MDPRDFFKKCLHQATLVVFQVIPSDYILSTPDTDWNVEQLLQHMMFELSWVPDLVQGLKISEVGSKYEGDLIGDSLHKNWQKAAKEAGKAVAEAKLEAMAHLSYANVVNEEYIWEVSGELLIHAWDLSIGINKPLSFPAELTEILYRRTKPNAENLHVTGLFAPIVKTDDDAPLQTKLLALFGRKAA